MTEGWEIVVGVFGCIVVVFITIDFSYTALSVTNEGWIAHIIVIGTYKITSKIQRRFMRPLLKLVRHCLIYCCLGGERKDNSNSNSNESELQPSSLALYNNIYNNNNNHLVGAHTEDPSVLHHNEEMMIKTTPPQDIKRHTLRPRVSHGYIRFKPISYVGVSTLILIVAVYVIIMWLGWSMVFFLSHDSIVDTDTKAPVNDSVNRFYFAGVTMVRAT